MTTSATSDPADTLQRIRELEQELAAQRRKVQDMLRDRRLDVVELRVSGSRYLVQVAAVREVVGVAETRPLPDSPEWVLGTIPFGHQTVPVVDLSWRLLGKPSVVDSSLLMVIVETPSWMALVADDVGDVLHLPPERIHSVPADVPSASLLVGVVPDAGGDEPGYLLSLALLGAEHGT